MPDRLVKMLRANPRWVVITGAGISAASGIPTYRNDQGEWQRSDPIQHQEFVDSAEMRRRYWARSMNGWPYVQASRPNTAHQALAELEALGHVSLLVTQNVDRLHQQAGSRNVVDLHGRLDRVLCRECGADVDRGRYQESLKLANPDYASHRAAIRPDGDADVADRWVDGFEVPPCARCGGMLMPDVVFFGGSVPRPRVDRIRAAVDAADALLVVGSSLMVYSGFRFCRQMAESGRPLLIVNRGITRADDLATLKVEGDGAEVLNVLLENLRSPNPPPAGNALLSPVAS